MLNISCKIVTIELENTLLNNFIADIFIFALIRFIATNIATDEESKTVPIFPTSLEIFFIFNKIKQITEIIVTIVTIVCNFSKRFVVLFNISCIVFSYFVFKIVFLYSVQICCTNLSKALLFWDVLTSNLSIFAFKLFAISVVSISSFVPL